MPAVRVIAGGACSAAILLVACSQPFEASPFDGGSDSPETDAAASPSDAAGREDAGPDGTGDAPDASSRCIDGGVLGNPREESVADSVGMCAEAFLFRATTAGCPTSFTLNLPDGAGTGSPITLGLYGDDGSCTTPGALLAQATWPGTMSAAPGWIHVPFAVVGGVTLVAGTCYWIAIASPAYIHVLDRAGTTSGLLSCGQTTACLGAVPTPSWGGGCASAYAHEGPVSAYVQ